MSDPSQTLVEQILDWLTLRNARCYAALALLMVAFSLPGFFTLQPMDRDEPRFAQASKQMLETRDYVAIRFQSEARNKKPVGIYWLQSGTVALAEAAGVPDVRHHIWLYRIPSFLGALCAVCATFWLTLAFASRRRALLAGGLLASTLLLGVEAHLAKTDAVLVALVTLTMAVLARLITRHKVATGHIWIFWLALSAGILVKGPLAVLFPALVIIGTSAMRRSSRWLLPLRPLLGLAIVLAMTAPWFILIALRTHGAFFADSLGQDMMSKVAGGQEAHGAWPGTYLLLFWLTAWPLAPFLLLAFNRIWAERNSNIAVFLALWIIPAWLIFEAVPTKLPHYVLPVYPAIAALIGCYLPGRDDTLVLWRKGIAAFALALVPLAIGAAASGLWLNSVFGFIPAWIVPEGSPPSWQWLGMGLCLVAALACVVSAIRALLQGQNELAAIASLPMALALGFAAYSFTLTSPAFAAAQLAPRLVAAKNEIIRLSGCPDLALVSTRLREPSLVFMTRTDIEFLDAEEAAQFLAQKTCSLAMVDQADEPAFLQALPATISHEPLQRISGVNLATGKRLDIGLYVRQ